MRFQGGGVGHSSTRDATQHFLADRHSTYLLFQHDTYAADEEPSNELVEEVEIEARNEDGPSDSSDSSSDDSSGEEDYGYVRYDSDEEDDEEKDPDAEEDEVEQLGFARF